MEQQHWLTPEKMAEYLDLVAQAIEDKNTNLLRDEANRIRYCGPNNEHRWPKDD